MAMTDAQAFDAMVAHHEQLEQQLTTLVASLRAATAAGAANGDVAAAKAAVARFVDEQLLPHALAEESAVYPSAAGVPGLAAFVAGMVLEHHALRAGAGLLADAHDPAAALAWAEAVAALFAAHAAKENDRILPALQAGGDGRLAASLAAMHAALEAAAAESPGDPGGTTTDLDVRLLAPAVRHPTIFARFGELRPGSDFVLVNDHDPRPLRYQLEAEHGGAFTWQYLEAGPRTWRVRIGRPAVPAAS